MSRAGMDERWILAYDGFDPEDEGLREALCALGNGRFVTRGAAEEVDAGDIHYPGTYVAGGYNQLASEVAGRTVTNEDLVNFPNWLCLTFQPEDGDWLDLHSMEVLAYRQELDLAAGVLTRRFRVRDDAGRVTAVESRRLVSMANPHLAAIDYRITPENWGGHIRIRSELDGSVRNLNVARYRQLSNRHLTIVDCGPVAPEGVFMLVRTVQSRFEVGMAARTRLCRGDEPLEPERQPVTGREDRVGEELRAPVSEGETLHVEKVLALYTSRDPGITEAGLDARLAIARAPGFAELFHAHRLAWAALWRRFDIEMDVAEPGEVSAARWQLIVRLHCFHILQTVSPHSSPLDVGAPARGLHGEAYRGHIFWDDVFIFPFFDDRKPSITRSLLLYRFHRLDAARELAREAGYAGAMYPWQSSSDGREATQEVHLNPLSGRWDPDHSRLQRHVNAGIVYNVWQYYQASGDREFLVNFGAEMVLEIARFWSSAATRNEETGRYEIHGVMGPDEYHEKYPDAETGGLRNNAYTNVMAVWCLLRAFDVLELVGEMRSGELCERIGIDDDELDRWRDITRRMLVPYHGDGIISQFEGYDDLEEFDWEGYRRRYGNIERLDRILKAEEDTPDRYKVSKQADLTMLFHLLDPQELKALFKRLGCTLDADTVHRNIDYYMARTSHGSTLSKVVYASVIHHRDAEQGCRLFFEALRSDIDDVQEGTTPEGIHLGAMAGTVGIVLRHYGGVRLHPRRVELSPELPPQIDRLAFRVFHRTRWLTIELTAERMRVTADRDADWDIHLRVGDTLHDLGPGETLELPAEKWGPTRTHAESLRG